MLKLLYTRSGVGLLENKFLASPIGPYICHPVDRKPHENIRWRPILGCMSA